MTDSVVTVLIRTQILPEHVEKGRDDLLELANQVRRKEADCLAIELAQDLDDPTRVTMIEKWSSRDAYEVGHMQSSHMKSFIDHSSKYFAGPPEISFCTGTQVGEAK